MLLAPPPRRRGTGAVVGEARQQRRLDRLFPEADADVGIEGLEQRHRAAVVPVVERLDEPLESCIADPAAAVALQQLATSSDLGENVPSEGEPRARLRQVDLQ